MDSGRALDFFLGVVTSRTLLDSTSCILPDTIETDISSVLDSDLLSSVSSEPSYHILPRRVGFKEQRWRKMNLPLAEAYELFSNHGAVYVKYVGVMCLGTHKQCVTRTILEA